MIHIKELYRLQGLGHLRLIAGAAGLDRTLTAAVLFEYDPSRMQLPDFYRGDLVVTTLAYARGDEQLVAHSLLALMNQGVAGLLIKTAYFSELPREVLAQAEHLGTPIFFFDDTYIEEVILEVTELIRGKRHFVGFEEEIDALMRGGLTAEQVREKFGRIDPAGSARYRVFALYPREHMPRLDEQIYALLNEDALVGRRLICMRWKRMLIILRRMEEKEETREEAAAQEITGLLQRAGVDASAMHVGASGTRTDRSQLGEAISEAVYAARAARIGRKALFFSSELGLYAYLLPIAENAFARQWCQQSLNKIREYDAANKANLEMTARAYVEADMEIAAAAKALFQHPNTVRYRLTKIQKLMGMEDSAMFLPMLSLTVQLSAILEDENER
ncbi:MAG: PucR family transcriptional regulator [Clostridia bacterium]|nr:PucR family transcriptional regulator [Clostridia bacterium]